MEILNLYILIVKGYRIEFPNIGRGISFSDTPDYKFKIAKVYLNKLLKINPNYPNAKEELLKLT